MAADRIERCCKTQEIAQAVHGVSTLDAKALQAYVGTTVKIALLLSLPGALVAEKLVAEILTLTLPGEGGGLPPHHWLHEHARASPRLRRNHGL